MLAKQNGACKLVFNFMTGEIKEIICSLYKDLNHYPLRIVVRKKEETLGRCLQRLEWRQVTVHVRELELDKRA